MARRFSTFSTLLVLAGLLSSPAYASCPPEGTDAGSLRLLREHEAGSGRRTPVLMVTAHAMTGDRERFLAAGANGYVSKPISAALLSQEMARVMHSPST